MFLPLDRPPGFPVQITNQTAWWVQSLPGLGSLLLAGALIGVTITVRRTNMAESDRLRTELDLGRHR